MPAPTLAEHFTEQAMWCDKLGSPFTQQLLLAMRTNLEQGGVIHELVHDWPTNPRADALSLRIAGALHYAVLSGMSPDLAAVYPVGTTFPPIEIIWQAVDIFLKDNTSWVRDFMKSPPQTNETRRSFMLLMGLKKIAQLYERPIHLLELGASAGLNQNFDAFFYDTGHWQWGDPASPMHVDTQWHGPAPDLSAPLILHERKACDQNPLDLSDAETRLRLKAYIWADHQDRLDRFDAAADIAVARHTHVEKADAADWLERELAARPDHAVTVVFHSVFFQYPPRDTRARITDLIETEGETASGDKPLVWLRYEPESSWDREKRYVDKMACDLRLWPGNERIILARSDGHVREVEVV